MSAGQDSGATRPTLDPIITLRVPSDTSGDSHIQEENTPGKRSSITSVCFLPTSSDSGALTGADSSSGEEEEEVSFRSRDLLQQEKRNDGDLTSRARDTVASLSLTGTRLASCHANGEAFVWDLGRRRIVANFGEERRGPGLALRRMDGSSNKIMYHTRDSKGTVSIHDGQTTETLTKFETHSFTFCTAAPSAGSSSLLVLPTQHDCYAAVRDIRIPPESPPIVALHGAGLDEMSGNDEHKHGMLSAVAMSDAKNDCGRPVVVCGMESGTIFFHDLRMPDQPLAETEVPAASRLGVCNVKVGKDPVLAIDIASSAALSVDSRSFVVIAGTAGNAVELSELPVEERGTVAVVKASFGGTEIAPTATARLRARVSTCEVGGPEDMLLGGKPGVSLCRFRPDGRMFAVGGWDRRLRIFDRSGQAAPLAILKGHTESVTAIDWANSQSTGFLATGAGDGRISIWRCFSS